MPPSKDDWPKLLRVLGVKSPEQKRPGRELRTNHGEHLCYNAFRCLRAYQAKECSQ